MVKVGKSYCKSTAWDEVVFPSHPSYIPDLMPLKPCQVVNNLKKMELQPFVVLSAQRIGFHSKSLDDSFLLKVYESDMRFSRHIWILYCRLNTLEQWLNDRRWSFTKLHRILWNHNPFKRFTSSNGLAASVILAAGWCGHRSGTFVGFLKSFTGGAGGVSRPSLVDLTFTCGCKGNQLLKMALF